MTENEPPAAERTGAPPLNAIRCYAAVVREGGVTAAADALGITQSAASRHVAVLERFLGAPLLTRTGRRAEPTDVGRAFVQSVGEALDVIDFTARRMRQPASARRRLTVRTSLPSFAFAVLVPRLATFTFTTPQLSVDLVTSLSPPAPDDPFDVLITRDLRLGSEHDHWHLLTEHAVLIVPPGKDRGGLSLEQAIASFPLLSTQSRPDLAPCWASALGLSVRDFQPGASFGHTFQALQAVVNGQGALVVPDILTAPSVQAGTVDIVAGSRVSTGMDYFAYAGRAPEQYDAVTAFCRQLRRLCRDLQAETDWTG